MWPFSRRPAPGDRSRPTRRTAEGDSASPGTGDLGRRGEKLARKILKQHGLKVLAANYRCPAGEADLIALDPSTRRQTGAETIAFVEVKTRRSDRHTDPESAVDDDKRRRLRKVADYYLHARRADEYNVRFDVVSIVMPPDQPPRTRYIRDAF